MILSTKSTLAALVTTIAMGICCNAASADVDTYKNTLKATCWVLAKDNGETSSGTGVLVDAEKRLVVTNYHVVGTARSAVVFFADTTNGVPNVDRKHYLKEVKKLGLRGRIVAADLKRDLALIELSRLPANAKALPLAKSSIGPGESVQSIGNPGSTEALWVYTSGTVRSVYQKKFRTGAGEHDFKVVETQSPINSGDSGGPVVNSAGELVAISQAISPKARLVSYCVDISELKDLMAEPWKPAPLSVTDMLDLAKVEYEKTKSDAYEVKMTPDATDDEKKQSVFITSEIEYYERADVRKIWSLAAVLDEAPSLETVTRLLRQNAKTKLGAWSIEETPDGKYLLIYVVKIDATATPATVKSTMEYVARLADKSKDEFKTETDAEVTQDASDLLDKWLAD